jgi:hypothetical protein
VARARYDAALEAWAERVSDAAVRMCRAMNAMGAQFRCGTTSSERAGRVRAIR